MKLRKSLIIKISKKTKFKAKIKKLSIKLKIKLSMKLRIKLSIKLRINLSIKLKIKQSIWS